MEVVAAVDLFRFEDVADHGLDRIRNPVDSLIMMGSRVTATEIVRYPSAARPQAWTM
jgi:hypothetical protein